MNSVKEVSISLFDDHRWLVSTPNNNHLLVNDATKKLIEILRDSSSTEDALNSFNHEFDQKLDQNGFKILIQSKLGDLDLLSSDSKPFKKSSYLNLKIKIFNSKVSGWMAQPFSWLFSPFLFWFLIVGCLFFLIWLSASFFQFEKAFIQANKLVINLVVKYSCIIM